MAYKITGLVANELRCGWLRFVPSLYIVQFYSIDFYAAKCIYTWPRILRAFTSLLRLLNCCYQNFQKVNQAKLIALTTFIYLN